MNFKNKTVVITGASSGIGSKTAELFGKKGANVVLVARRQEKLEEIEKKISKNSTSVLVCKCDISDKSQVEEMRNRVLDQFKTIDVLVNNAGFGIYGKVSDLTIEEIEDQIKTNFLGMVYCIKNFLPILLQQNSGHIVNVASVAASVGLPRMAAYSASKFAMLGFSESLHHELEGTGVGVTVVSPIMVNTEFFKKPSFNIQPKEGITCLSPGTVAKAIVKASSSSKLEIIVPRYVRSAVWIKQTFPFLINPIIAGSFKRQMENKKN